MDDRVIVTARKKSSTQAWAVSRATAGEMARRLGANGWEVTIEEYAADGALSPSRVEPSPSS